MFFDLLRYFRKKFATFRASASAIPSDRYIDYLSRVGRLVFGILMVVLALRAMMRIEPRWDSFWYHIPFAAIRGGLDLPYELNEFMRNRFDGFPPFPHFVQGVLWRLTGSINATNVANYAAFGMFLLFSGRTLKAPVWLVGSIALTAPLILIHSTVTYVDLFANCWLAIGISSLLYAYYYEKQADRELLLWGLIGLIGAAWSKFQLVPIVAVFFVISFIFYWRSNLLTRQRRNVLVMLLLAAVIAALPYLKNLVYYHNPFWPVEMPIMGAYFPYSEGSGLITTDGAPIRQRPPHLDNASQFALFFHSLLEIGHPTRYAHRARWIIDQGNASVAFRMGGFWWPSVIVFLAAAIGMGVIKNRRKGIIMGFAIVAFFCFVAVLPQSHQLRYYQFIPLTWAALIGMLYPALRQYSSHMALALALLIFVMFLYVSNINRTYYKIERVDYQTAANLWKASRWWANMDSEKTYCAVGMEPIGIILTGPTMSEFSIVERRNEHLCPEDTVVLREPFLNWQKDQKTCEDPSRGSVTQQGLCYYNRGKFELALEMFEVALNLEPGSALAFNNICAARNSLGQLSEGVKACEKALKLNPDFRLARGNLDWAKRQLEATHGRCNDGTEIQRGLCFYKVGEFQLALEMFEVALNLDPGSALALNNICAARNSLGQFSEGVKACEKALELDPDLDLARNNLEWAERQLDTTKNQTQPRN